MVSVQKCWISRALSLGGYCHMYPQITLTCVFKNRLSSMSKLAEFIKLTNPRCAGFHRLLIPELMRSRDNMSCIKVARTLVWKVKCVSTRNGLTPQNRRHCNFLSNEILCKFSMHELSIYVCTRIEFITYQYSYQYPIWGIKRLWRTIMFTYNISFIDIIHVAWYLMHIITCIFWNTLHMVCACVFISTGNKFYRQ